MGRRSAGKQSETIAVEGGLAHARTDAAHEELPVIQRKSAQHREDRPQDERARHDISAVGPVGEPGDRNAAGHVKEREGNAGEEGGARVG
jgi:hypothetical protein